LHGVERRGDPSTRPGSENERFQRILGEGFFFHISALYQTFKSPVFRLLKKEISPVWQLPPTEYCPSQATLAARRLPEKPSLFGIATN